MEVDYLHGRKRDHQGGWHNQICTLETSVRPQPGKGLEGVKASCREHSRGVVDAQLGELGQGRGGRR